MDMRIEKDSLGEMQLPANAYYGPQTQRAVNNFPISGLRFQRSFIHALGLIKYGNACAQKKSADNKKIWEAIAEAALEVAQGKWDEQFVVDIYQTGSGTSTNMNTNEVIARRATEIMTGKPDDTPRIHPNDHVNKGQSSNDVFPAAIHIAAALELSNTLLPAIKNALETFQTKSEQFKNIIKIGRTHLQDATPITLGQEFSGYTAQLKKSYNRIEAILPHLLELPLGGTAVGTGLNTTPEITQYTIEEIRNKTGLSFIETDNHFEAQAAKDAVVQASGTLKTVASSLMKIANDIRWLGSGPRCGLGEIELPATQPGSSIMPGKVNPVQAESLTMVCAKVIGNDATITIAGQSGNFELNVMMPVAAYSLLESIQLLSNGLNTFVEKCVVGLKANSDRCAQLTEQSLALITSLVPVVGYDAAAELAKQAHKENRTIRELLESRGELSSEEINRLLDPSSML